MADRLTVARPYARAAFEEARAEGRLGPWAKALHIGAEVVKDERVQALLGNPHVTPAQLAQLVIDIAGPELAAHGHNFVRTLAVNHRLGYLPALIGGALLRTGDLVIDGSLRTRLDRIAYELTT